MCNYFKKMHPCGHLSRLQIDRCIEAITTNEVCVVDTPSDDELRKDGRKSCIACFNCIAAEAYAEHNEAAKKAAAEEQDPVKREQLTLKSNRLTYKENKLEGMRKEAEEKMRAERAEDEKKAAMKKAEEERAKKEGGAWTDAGRARKKNRKGRSGVEGRAPKSAPLPGMEPKKMGEFKLDVEGPKAATGTEFGGRAGVWGKGAPKKILTKAENEQDGWRK